MLAIVPTAAAAFSAIYGTYLRGQISVRDGRAQGLIGKATPDGAPLASVDGTTWIGFLRYHGARLDIYQNHLALHRYGRDDRLADPIVLSSKNVGRVALGRKTGERLRLFDRSDTGYAWLFWATDPVVLRRALDRSAFGELIS